MVAFLLLAAPLTAPAASAHEATSGRLVVPGDHFQPGDPLSILGSQIAGRRVSLRLVRGEISADLGEAGVSLEGTFEAVASVPPTFPHGYAELIATDENGNVATTTILIGDRPEGAEAQARAEGPVDERLIGLLLGGVGLIVVAVAGLQILRGRPKGGSAAR